MEYRKCPTCDEMFDPTPGGKGGTPKTFCKPEHARFQRRVGELIELLNAPEASDEEQTVLLRYAIRMLLVQPEEGQAIPPLGAALAGIDMARDLIREYGRQIEASAKASLLVEVDRLGWLMIKARALLIPNAVRNATIQIRAKFGQPLNRRQRAFVDSLPQPVLPESL